MPLERIAIPFGHFQVRNKDKHACRSEQTVKLAVDQTEFNSAKIGLMSESRLSASSLINVPAIA